MCRIVTTSGAVHFAVAIFVRHGRHWEDDIVDVPALDEHLLNHAYCIACNIVYIKCPCDLGGLHAHTVIRELQKIAIEHKMYESHCLYIMLTHYEHSFSLRVFSRVVSHGDSCGIHNARFLFHVNFVM